jgi:hypothetical protein
MLLLASVMTLHPHKTWRLDKGTQLAVAIHNTRRR